MHLSTTLGCSNTVNRTQRQQRGKCNPPPTFSPPSSPTSGITPHYEHSKTKIKRSVRISTAKDEVQIVDRLQDIAADFEGTVWFSRKELNDTMAECRETVRQMREGAPLSDADDVNSFTTRGLEYCTPDGFDIATSSLDVVLLILEEQRRQKALGIVDQEMLAAAAGGISRHRLRIAHLAAMKDARAVYGSDKQWTMADGMEGPARSDSFTSKRGSRRGSFGAVEEKVRRRRGSRGPLGERAVQKSASDNA